MSPGPRFWLGKLQTVYLFLLWQNYHVLSRWKHADLIVPLISLRHMLVQIYKTEIGETLEICKTELLMRFPHFKRPHDKIRRQVIQRSLEPNLFWTKVILESRYTFFDFYFILVMMSLLDEFSQLPMYSGTTWESVKSRCLVLPPTESSKIGLGCSSVWNFLRLTACHNKQLLFQITV